MYRSSGFLCLIVASCIALPKLASGATFSIDLHPVTATGTNGNYLVAPFDFGTAFSQIESMKVEFVMPNGYEGGIASTGNSTYSNTLNVAAHEGPTLPVPEPGLIDLFAVGFMQRYFHVSMNTITEAQFGPLTLSTGIGDPQILWPDFVLAGQGWISFIKEATHTSHPLPAGTPVGASATWNEPEIASARLIIVGTPVPEPAAIVLFSFGATALWLRRAVGFAN